jgi:predicted GNAT superfamily acetyltransferase
MPCDAALPDGVPVVAGPPGTAPALDAPLPGAPRVAVRIPADYATLLRDDLESARDWRVSARRAFLHYLPLGYRVDALVTAGEHGTTYLLTRST